MTALQEAEKLLPALSRAEKAQLLQWVINDLSESFPGIESRAGVCGGEPCIVRTRIPVWALEQMGRLGIVEADILRSTRRYAPKIWRTRGLMCARTQTKLSGRLTKTRTHLNTHESDLGKRIEKVSP